jgi:hypothetical protein
MSATIFESSFPGTVYLFDKVGLNIPREISDTISGSNFIQLTAFTGSDNTSTIKITSINSEIIGESPQRLEVNSILSGINPTASAPGAATFGINNIATNTGSFVEGVGTLATGFAAHAAGFNTTASGYAAFSVGVETDAEGTASFAAGSGSLAKGTATVAFGIGTVASSSGQLVAGHYNETKTDINNIFVVGDGTSNSLRRNVIEVYGGQGALFRGVKIDTVSPSGPTTTTIDGFNVYGKTIFYGGVTHSGIITVDDDYGGITHNSASYIAETYTSLGALRGRTLFNYKGIDFNNSVQTTAPSSTHLWTNSSNRLFYSSSAIILNGGNTLGSTMLIGTNDTNNLELETSGSVRMTINSSGRVGIGTTTPTAELHISGASNSNLLRVGSPTNANILFVSGSGNVGINTTSPMAFFSGSGGVFSSGEGNIVPTLTIFQSSSATGLNAAGLQIVGSGSSALAAARLNILTMGDKYAYLNIGTSGSGTENNYWEFAKRPSSALHSLLLSNYSNGVYQSSIMSLSPGANTSIIGSSDQILLEGSTGYIGLQTAVPGTSDWIHLHSKPNDGNYINIDATQTSNPPPLTTATAKHGYGIITNAYYLAEPDYWMEIKLDGNIVLIPCYLPAP